MNEIQKLLPDASWFRDWVSLWPTVESPESYILFTGMSMFGSVLGRRVWFDNDFVKIYPMLNLLLIGPSGVGKSTCITGLGVPLIRDVPARYRVEVVGPGTKEKLHDILFFNPKALLVASELANFFGKAKYLDGLVAYVTELLDYGPYIEINTKSGDRIRVNDPAVTIIGGSTIEWLQEQLPDAAATGGFLARFLIVAEENKRQRVALPGMMHTPKEKQRLLERRTNAFYAFNDLVSRPEGSIVFRDFSVADIFNQWYLDLKPETGHLAPFIERGREFVLRFAILVCLSCGRLQITEPDIVSAIRLYDLATKRLKSVVVPFTVDGKLQAEVLKALGRGILSEEELFSALKTISTSQKTKMLIDSLIMSGDIKRTGDGKLKRRGK